MISRRLAGVLLGLVLFISLLSTAPARLLSVILPQGQVQLLGYSGTVWDGSASRAVVRLGSGYMHLGAVQWSLQPLSLLLLAPRLSLNSKWGQQLISGELVLRGDQDMDLHNFSASVAADLVRQYAPVALRGNFNAQFSQLQLREGLPYSAAGRLVWQGAAWDAPGGQMPLGDYAVEIQQAPGEALSGEVLTLSGPLEAVGGIQLQGREYQVDILLNSDVRMDAQLQQALSLMAAPESGGYRVKLNGQF